jgi:hypothetical protein
MVAVRSIADAGARTDGAAHSARTHRDVGAAHSDGQTGPDLERLTERPGNIAAGGRIEVTHRRARPIIARAVIIARKTGARLLWRDADY